MFKIPRSSAHRQHLNPLVSASPLKKITNVFVNIRIKRHEPYKIIPTTPQDLKKIDQVVRAKEVLSPSCLLSWFLVCQY